VIRLRDDVKQRRHELRVLDISRQQRLSALSRSVFSYLCMLSWRRGVVVSGVRRMNEVNAHRARLVLGWVHGCSGAGTRADGVPRTFFDRGTRPPLPPLFWTEIRAKVSPLLQLVTY